MDWTTERIGVKNVRFLVKFLTVFTACIYGIVILWLLWNRDEQIFYVVILPAAGFLAVTLLRKGIGARRPYEVFDFTPLLKKDSRGNSFPSRHVFSNVIIAMAVFKVCVPLGILLSACSGLLALLRVITGVHFPRDVIGGALIAVVLGVVGYIL
jgi:membrane-associated phospholipid phosphatase